MSLGFGELGLGDGGGMGAGAAKVEPEERARDAKTKPVADGTRILKIR